MLDTQSAFRKSRESQFCMVIRIVCEVPSQISINRRASIVFPLYYCSGKTSFTINRQRKTAKISGKNSLQSSQRSVRAISLIIEAVKQQKSIFITHIQKLPAVQWELFHFCGVLLQLGCKNTDKCDNNVPTATLTQLLSNSRFHYFKCNNI